VKGKTRKEVIRLTDCCEFFSPETSASSQFGKENLQRITNIHTIFGALRKYRMFSNMFRELIKVVMYNY
jgi:hypothetical protein